MSSSAPTGDRASIDGGPDRGRADKASRRGDRGESNACGAQTECNDLYACLVECEPIDLACNDDCYDTFDEGIGPLQDLLECADEECNAVCG